MTIASEPPVRRLACSQTSKHMHAHAFCRPPAQCGFTLVELMVSILIGLFLVGGLLTLEGAMKRTTTTQSALSQLQDNERLAMTLMSDVIQSTGYFADPTTNSASSAFQAIAGSFNAGQALIGAGTYTDPAPGHQWIAVRYLTSGTLAAPPYNDNNINCSGNTSSAAATFINQFSVDANGNLNCLLTLNGVAQPVVPLIGGLKSMQIYYGVHTNAAVGGNSVDTYMDGDSVGAGNYWNKVISVKVTLNFVNPLYGQPGQTQASQQTIPFTRVIAVMSKTGVST